MAKKTIKDLKFDKHNFNAHTPEGMELLDKSINQFGFGRSVVVDKHDNLIGGNGVVETAIKQGKTKIIEVETDGTELVVVRRKDIDLNTKEGRDMAFADNATAKQGIKWNDKELEYARKKWGVKSTDWGVEMPAFAELERNQDPTEEEFDNLPEELQGLDITPNKLENIKGDETSEYERVIIVFPKEKSEEVAHLIGIPQIEKVIYEYKELIGE